MQDTRIRFHYMVPPFHFPQRRRLKQFLLHQLRRKKKAVEAINYIFCSDEYLLQLNKQHLKHNTLTDIITFELSAPGAPLLADIYISVERVRENALDFGTSFSAELHRVIFHGALHLAGYKDKKASEATLMRRQEDAWLAAYRST